MRPVEPEQEKTCFAQIQGFRDGQLSGTPQQADEKPVGVGPARRHQQALARNKHAAAEKIGALTQGLGLFPRFFRGKSGWRAVKALTWSPFSSASTEQAI
jgi:hypothetical protein